MQIPCIKDDTYYPMGPIFLLGYNKNHFPLPLLLGQRNLFTVGLSAIFLLIGFSKATYEVTPLPYLRQKFLPQSPRKHPVLHNTTAAT